MAKPSSPAAALRPAALLAMMLLLALPTQAQDLDLPVVTRTYAIENARIVQAPGRILERGTVVIRDGLILAVGASVNIPYDAARIAGDSMVVYAGFIDGLSNTGVPKPKDDANPERVDDPGNPPNDRAGIEPERDVRRLLNATDKSIADLREAGFGAAHVMPYGRMLPGSSAVILLAGDDPGGMVLKSDVALAAQFEGARGVYPGTPMGVMAKMRQLYREAQRRHQIEALYAENPAGLERPSYDAVHYAFFPVIEQQKPIIYYVDGALETHRALRLQRDLGFPLILSGLNQSFDLVDDLAAADVPLLFSLKLPADPKWIAKIKQDSLDTIIAGFDREANAATYRDLEAEQRNLEARQLMSRKNYLANAAMLHDAGLTFGFTTMGVKPGDVHKNLRSMIAHGLPEDAALAALTTHPAQILGVSQSLGTVEAGKIANLVVTTGPYFEEDTRIRYVFVDGQQFTYDVTKKSARGADGEAANPVGTWSYAVATPQGEVGGTITLTGTPSDLSGTITNDMSPGAQDLKSLSLDGNMLSFSFDNPNMGEMTVEVEISGDEIEGSITVPGVGPIPLTGTRDAPPD